MRYPARGPRRERATVCISSQAGCAVGCPFCATGELGFLRDLDTAEIVDQVRFWRRRLGGRGPAGHQRRVHGHGRAAAQHRSRCSRPRRAERSARASAWARATSRSAPAAWCPACERLTELRPQYTLAVSLHAARDPRCATCWCRSTGASRSTEVVDAARDYAARDGPARHVRVRDDRRHQRHAGRRRAPWPSCCAASSPTSTSSP